MAKKGSEFEVIPFKKLPSSKAWKFTSQYVRLKGDGFCYTCGKKYGYEKLVAGHFREKIGGSSTYFDLRNLRSQCYYCNVKLHGNKQEYSRKLVNEYGKDILNELALLGSKSKQWTRKELDEIAKMRENDIKELKEKLSTEKVSF